MSGLRWYWRQGQTGGTLTQLLLAGTLPGVIAGPVIRVYVLPGPVVAIGIRFLWAGLAVTL